MIKKEVVLITTHVINYRVKNLYYLIKRAVALNADVYLLIDKSTTKNDLHIPEDIRHEFYIKEELFSMGFKAISDNIIPGSNHFILFWFFNRHRAYQRYWIIEYDVAFSDDWKYFFNCTNELEVDFLATHIKRYSEDPMWYWWGSMIGQISNIPFKNRIRSFNPIMRISFRALLYLFSLLKCGGNGGHHEEVIATLLNEGGFSLFDLGNCGSFSSKNISFSFCNYKIPPPLGTMRHKPSFNPLEIVFWNNLLIHPIKNDFPFI